MIYKVSKIHLYVAIIAVISFGIGYSINYFDLRELERQTNNIIEKAQPKDLYILQCWADGGDMVDGNFCDFTGSAVRVDEK